MLCVIAFLTQPSLGQEFCGQMVFFRRWKKAATLPSVKINEYSQLSVGPLRPQKFPSFKWNVTSFFSSLFLGYSLRSCRCLASLVHCYVTPLILIMDFSLDHQWLQLCSLIFSIWRIPWVTLQYLKHSLKPHFVPVDSKKQTIVESKFTAELCI